MKAVQKLLWVGALAALASGCSGKASPEATITCGGTPGTQEFELFLVVQKSILASDPALGGDVPANGIVATVISPTPAVEICAGSCDAGDSFSDEKDVVVDENGILLYTVGIVDGTIAFQGDIIEVFSAVDTCFSTITLDGIP